MLPAFFKMKRSLKVCYMIGVGNNLELESGYRIFGVYIKPCSNMSTGWIYLLVASLLEIGFVTTLKLTHDSKNLPLQAVFVACLIGSIYFLDKSLSTIPVGTAYAVWTGIGATGTAIIGILFFKDPVTVGRMVFLGLLIMSIVGLKLTSGH